MRKNKLCQNHQSNQVQNGKYMKCRYNKQLKKLLLDEIFDWLNTIFRMLTS